MFCIFCVFCIFGIYFIFPINSIFNKFVSQWVSHWVSQWDADIRRLWSDPGPIEMMHICVFSRKKPRIHKLSAKKEKKWKETNNPFAVPWQNIWRKILFCWIMNIMTFSCGEKHKQLLAPKVLLDLWTMMTIHPSHPIVLHEASKSSKQASDWSESTSNELRIGGGIDWQKWTLFTFNPKFLCYGPI